MAGFFERVGGQLSEAISINGLCEQARFMLHIFAHPALLTVHSP